MILAIIWDKIILRFIKKPDYTKSSEEFLQNLKKLANNDEIVIRDNGVLKLTIGIDLLYIIIAIFVISFNLTQELDSWKEMARKGALILSIILIIYKIYSIFFVIYNKNKFISKIKISKDKLEYSFDKTDISIDLNKNEAIKIKYNYIPKFHYEIEKKDDKLLSDDRYGSYIFIPFNLFLFFLQYAMFLF